MRIPKWQIFKLGGCSSYLLSIMVLMCAIFGTLKGKSLICGDEYTLDFDKYKKATKLE